MRTDHQQPFWAGAAQKAIVRAQIEWRHWTRRLADASKHQEGQAMAEYVVLLVVIALALAAVVALGGTIRAKFEQVNAQISGAY
jgi:Flp pilus assembly pilin Flp